MRKLAELAIRGPKQATALAVLFACAPMLFWISAAIISLVILRRGMSQGVKVLAWALLPAIAWAAMGQFATITGLIATTALACVLRQTVSWHKTFLALLPVGALVALMMAQLAPQQITMLILTDIVLKIISDYLTAGGQSTVDIGNWKPLVEYGVIGMTTWFNLVGCIVGLILARSWQAQLFNPGGFREEFHGVRLPATTALLLMVLALGGLSLAPIMLVIAPVVTLPLLLSGLALMHGLVGIRQLGRLWLVVFYMLLFFVTQLMYPVIIITACLDSLFDFRGRLTAKLHQG
ncbi:hypothetical protein ACH42_09890 [Endozoicomonas sp. (ex Bugula neritina AB1)]|nr:hypothetical protein ACH42_09890 [Endozoicomonas sp. (ex Bugula neritina AB1)]